MFHKLTEVFSIVCSSFVLIHTILSAFMKLKHVEAFNDKIFSIYDIPYFSLMVTDTHRLYSNTPNLICKTVQPQSKNFCAV